MASPETVAQIFPRAAMFDVVIFDEASQCRLEEALPVLVRGKRVVIAGDPKQLPPTRFFESAVAVSEDEEIESDQQLFEIQQAEVEDLLGAALNLSIQQCYLDVHYRSRNADLIEFSNEHFYGSRLQAIPGHPSNRSRFAPLTLYRANGVYEDSENPIEAEQVCKIVRDLLRRAQPPSIGIACFNVNQRDLIVEKLDELAVEDTEFGRKLAEARTRQGSGSFEGLFVKNLENVQGDARDHIIISTTYGPDPKGRFYRRFGPLGRAGGGRRLNVLTPEPARKCTS
jgi:superfamily I DNA and/or RNA helicase